MKSGGEIPGLRLFEPDTDADAYPRLWQRFTSMFALPLGEGYDPLEPDDVGYEDISGSGWAGGGGGGGGGGGEDEDWDIEGHETLLIMVLIVGVAVLGWARTRFRRYAREQADRVVREREERLQREELERRRREEGRAGDGVH